MTKELAERAYIAGFNTALASFGKVRSVYLNAHCMVEFDKWYMGELDGMIPAPELSEVTVTLPERVRYMQSIGRGSREVGEPVLFDFSKLPRPGDANYKRRPTVEEQEAANFEAFDPDAFVPPVEPREDDE